MTEHSSRLTGQKSGVANPTKSRVADRRLRVADRGQHAIISETLWQLRLRRRDAAKKETHPNAPHWPPGNARVFILRNFYRRGWDSTVTNEIGGSISIRRAIEELSRSYKVV